MTPATPSVHARGDATPRPSAALPPMVSSKLPASAPLLASALLLALAFFPGAARAAPLGPWSFRAANGPDGYGEWMPAQVPGSVHTDLLRAGKIEDPFSGTNEKGLQWIERTDWEYRATLGADAALLAHQRVDLGFAGLDTYAEVSVNGTAVLSANNMFRSWRVDVRPHLRAGDNELLVRFRSPIVAVATAYDTLGYKLPAANDQAERMVSMFTRKAPYHFGWDWGPRFVTSGIWRPVTVEAWDAARLADVHVQQRELSDERARLTVTATVEALRAGRGRVTVALAGGATLGTAEADLVPGENRVPVEVAIERPERWWPAGLGAQKLYPLQTTLAVNGSERGTRATRIGLRTVTVDTSRDEHGRAFTVVVNGIPVFMKGANYIPSDSFLDRVDDARYRFLMQSTIDANMNMLRVWGGGIYEDDRFYDLADEMGILIFQDFMFACSMYPGDAPFLENVRQEALENVRRLRNHASLALWAGNNENETAWLNWGWQQRFNLDAKAQEEIWRAYRAVFHEILPAVVAAEDPGRFYTPSSPTSGEEGVGPGTLGWGDHHYWGVWHAEEPYEKYAANTSRFMSEYGFQSFPTLETVRRYAPESEWRIESPVMLHHQRHPRGNQLIRTYMQRDFHVPEDFDDFLYLSQVLQATVIQYGAEAHRRAWPYNAGSLYWQLDDCWPVASWSGIDYYGRWKALHYAARRFFAPLLLSPVDEQGEVKLFVVSDHLVEMPGRLVLRLVDLAGGEGGAVERWRAEREVRVAANSSAVHFRAPREEVLAGADPRRVVLVVELHDGRGKPVASNLLFFAKTRDLELPPPELAAEVTGNGDTAIVKVTARHFARAVWLTTADGEGSFDDNFFDLVPGETAAVTWAPPAGSRVDVERLRAALRVRSVRDTY